MKNIVKIGLIGIVSLGFVSQLNATILDCNSKCDFVKEYSDKLTKIDHKYDVIREYNDLFVRPIEKKYNTPAVQTKKYTREKLTSEEQKGFDIYYTVQSSSYIANENIIKEENELSIKFMEDAVKTKLKIDLQDPMYLTEYITFYYAEAEGLSKKLTGIYKKELDDVISNAVTALTMMDSFKYYENENYSKQYLRLIVSHYNYQHYIKELKEKKEIQELIGKL